MFKRFGMACSWTNRARRVLALAVIAGMGACAQAQAADLLGVRFGPGPSKTRIVIDLGGAVEYRLSGDEQGQGRLFIDMEGVSVGARGLDGQAGKGHIRAYRYAPVSRDEARFVFEFKKTAKVAEAFLLEPTAGVTKYRLVIDLQTADMDAFMASLPERYPDLADVIQRATAPEAAPQSSPQEPATIAEPEAAPKAADNADWPVIVIDAGHGGADPGASGGNGALEKTVTLTAAMELAKILKETGRYRIVLTRAADAKISLEERTERARQAEADLFISLHADAHHDSRLRGASVYTLSEKGTERGAREAREEGDYQIFDLNIGEHSPEVGGILYDLAQRKTTTESSIFAEILVHRLAATSPMLNNSHRKADYRVLLAPDVPAVLVELGFISNEHDEANLTSPAWRRRIAGAVADAINDYFDKHAAVRHASRATKAANQAAIRNN